MGTLVDSNAVVRTARYFPRDAALALVGFQVQDILPAF
jgi:hypothetical protein